MKVINVNIPFQIIIFITAVLLYSSQVMSADEGTIIMADAIHEKQANGIVAFSGNVEITNSYYTVHSDYALIQYDKENPKTIIQMELEGNIKYIQESNNVTNTIEANRCEVKPSNKNIRFFGISYLIVNSKKYPGSVLLYNYDKRKVETIIY